MDDLRALVSIIVEAKMREADTSDGKRVPFASSKHLKDLEKRIKDLSYWRDKEKKGSDARANYTRIIQKLKSKLKTVRAKLSK